MTKPITTIGSTNVDMITRLPRLPGKGETVTGGQFLQTFGGKGANQAVASVRASKNTPCVFLTCLGKDVFSPSILENFKRDGMDISRILIDPKEPTGNALIMFDDNGDNCIAVSPGANYALRPSHIDDNADLIRGSAMIILQMEIPLETTRRVLEVAKSVGVPVMLNYAPVVTKDLKLDDAVTILILNEHEAAEICGQKVETVDDAKRVSVKLLANGHKTVGITLGSAGAVLADASGVRVIPTFKVKPVDSTAAGDTFCGALAVGLVEGMSLDQAARFASAAAAICVSRLGAQPSIPTRAEIEALLAGHSQA